MVLVILIAATLLRLATLNQSLWLDEAINLNNAASLDFKTLLLKYSLSDFHPPLYHAVLKLWIMLAGTSEVSARIPSVVFGVLTVYLTYLIGKKLFEQKTALIAATLMATGPLAIYYSQEARMYSMAAAAAAASVYFFVSILKKDKLINWIGFITSTTVLLYSDYLPYLLLPVYAIYLQVNRKVIKKGTFRAFIPAFIIITIALIPWLLIMPQQLHTGLSAKAASPAWSQVVGSPEAKSLPLTLVKFTIGRISIDNNLIYALAIAPIALFVGFLFALATFRISKSRSFLWYWLILPLVLGFALSFKVPVFSYFRFLFILPAFYLIAASAINSINWPPLVRFLLGIFLAINLTSSIIYFANPKFRREDWRGATAYVVQNSNKNTIAIFESNFTIGAFDYYNQNKAQAAGGLDSFTPNPKAVKEIIGNATKGKNKVFLFQYLSGITDPQGLIFENLSNLGFVNTTTKDFNGVGFVYEFTK
ncbi:MAG TPA: glycosyltransferase family 39 protein [Candidatus Saccharimonadales bacterium]|nr:glycosyltransferase family 39 protein [Candidatus Saccharimonadales bacterium]